MEADYQRFALSANYQPYPWALPIADGSAGRALSDVEESLSSGHGNLAAHQLAHQRIIHRVHRQYLFPTLSFRSVLTERTKGAILTIDTDHAERSRLRSTRCNVFRSSPP